MNCYTLMLGIDHDDVPVIAEDIYAPTLSEAIRRFPGVRGFEPREATEDEYNRYVAYWNDLEDTCPSPFNGMRCLKPRGHDPSDPTHVAAGANWVTTDDDSQDARAAQSVQDGGLCDCGMETRLKKSGHYEDCPYRQFVTATSSHLN